MSRVIYSLDTTGSVALAAATLKTVMGVVAPSGHGIDLLGYWLAFDGTTVATPVFYELCSLTAASNSTPGAGNTNESAQIYQEGGRAIASGFLAFSNCTAEPTVQSPIKSGLISPNGGGYEYEWGALSPDMPVSQGFCIRMIAPAAVNVRVGFRFARL